MKKILVLTALLTGALAFAATGFADPGDHGKGKGKGKSSAHVTKAKKVYTFGPYNVTTEDNGSCGQPWATNTMKRTFKVKVNKNGTYRVTRRDRGTFITMDAPSPGSCDTTGKHGQHIRAGVKGKMHGWLVGRVSGATFTPNAACDDACGGDTTTFISTIFGSGATFTCSEGFAGCRFNYEYSAPAQNLDFHHWQDRSHKNTEVFHGDIADS